MKLWLVRHARPMLADGLCYGASDVAADPAATAAAASALAQVLPPRLGVRSSPLQRCTALAQALQQLRPDLTWTPDPRLAEMDFGCWEGRPWTEVDAAEFGRWTADFGAYRFGGRESVHEFMQRVGQAHADHAAAQADSAWITHAGVIAAVQLLRRGELPTQASAWPRNSLGLGRWQLA